LAGLSGDELHAVRSGQRVLLSSGGFTPRSVVTVVISQNGVTTVLATVIANSRGRATAVVALPTLTRGSAQLGLAGPATGPVSLLRAWFVTVHR
jgi:hypothetical protein